LDHERHRGFGRFVGVAGIKGRQRYNQLVLLVAVLIIAVELLKIKIGLLSLADGRRGLDWLAGEKSH
jgi:hypothetical protein